MLFEKGLWPADAKSGHSVGTWIIGDIHGCMDPLEAILSEIPEEDDLVFLGDYIDRGPEPRGVVERLLRERHRAVFLRGNHEDAMLAHFGRLDFAREHPELLGPDSHWRRANFGAGTTLQSYGLEPEDPWEALPPEHRSFFEALRFYYEHDEFLAVHAGLRIADSTDPREQDPDDLFWIRWDWVSREAEWRGKFVYFGHFTSIQMFGRQRASELLHGQRSLGIDTGCGYGGYLTAYCHETGQVLQEPQTGSGRGSG